jgi:hypothetical protein
MQNPIQSRGYSCFARSRCDRGTFAHAGGAALTAPRAGVDLPRRLESDGEAANPQRYTTVGRDAYEVDRIQSELAIMDQLGPIYFAHNNEVSYAGVPAPTGGRRMAMAWDLAITEADTTPAMLELFDSAIKWLLNNKTGAKIVVALPYSFKRPRRALDRRPHLVDDDTTVTEAQLPRWATFSMPAYRGATAAFPMSSSTQPMPTTSSPAIARRQLKRSRHHRRSHIRRWQDR